MRNSFRSIVWLFVAVLSAPAFLFAQGHPMPGSSSEPPVICSLCGNKPTFPYSAPIVTHRGRYLDSTRVRLLQGPIRTYRAERVAIVPELDRIYMKIGSTFASYRLSTFYSRDLNGPMVSLNASRDPAEQFLPFLDSVYPELSSDWVTIFQDGQERLGPWFDWDDRGYVYIPAKIFGWGIVKDVGNLQFVKQYGGPLGGDGADVNPYGMISFKVQGVYYLYVWDNASAKGALFDVTNPSAAKFVRNLSRDMSATAKATIAGEPVIAYTDVYTGEIKIFSASRFMSGGSPDRVIAPPSGTSFTAIDSDGTRFFAVAGSATVPANLAIVEANGSSVPSYAATYYPIPGAAFAASSITYSDGVLTTVGFAKGDAGVGNDLHMFRLTSGAPQYVDFKNYFKKYYTGWTDTTTSKSYAGAGNTNVVHTGVFHKEGGKEYVLYAIGGLGDVYEIQASEGISIEREAAAGTANPYSEGTSGPFYGDLFRFRTASTGAATAIDVDFGNPEASSGNIVPATTGQSLSYRYSGLSTAALIQQTRTVKITAAGDSTKTASASVTMSVPSARVRGMRSNGVKDPALLFIQPNASATAPLVVGDSFVDASDGTVESHYSTWTRDAEAPVKQLPNAPFDVGQCGTHALTFSAVYGAYENFTSRTSPDYTAGVTNINYEVRPFASRIAVVTSDATSYTFGPETRAGGVTGGVNAAATFTWELLNASGQPVRSQGPASAALGSGPTFVVQKSELNGNTVKLTVSVDPALVSAACSTMASSTASVQLLVPDPVVTISGCGNVGSACSFTANSSSGQDQSGWTYAWYLDGTLRATTATKAWTPDGSILATAKSYTIKVSAESAAGITGESTLGSFTLQPALCAAIPADPLLYFTWSGQNPTCAAGTCTSASEIKFFSRASGYSIQDCDTVSWSFGDGQAGTGRTPTHKYAANGTYNVTLSISNNQTPQARSVTQSITLGSAPPPPPPPPTGCDSPSPLLGFNMRGTASGCTGLLGAPDCSTGEAISFTAVNFPASKAFQSCDTFSWNFGDGTTSNAQNPTKIYAQAGTYEAKLTVANSSNPTGVTASLVVKVAGSSSGGGDPNCKIPDGSRMYIEYSAPSGCSNLPGSNPCNPGEVVTISLKALGSFQSCDSFDWNFGDGTSSANTKTTTVQHQFPATLPEYTVTVTIKNNSGSATVSEKVKFGLQGVEKPTSVDFSWGSTTPIIGTPVTFTATANAPGNYPVTSWQWNFGDGVTGTGNPVQHVFSTEGPWTVTLTASNAGGSAAPVSKQINVLKANAFTYLLPVVSHLPGANGSQWRTDLQIYNANVGEGDVELEFELTNKSLKKSFKLSASTLVYEDFMSFFTDGDWAGPVIVRGAATHDLQIWTRTYSVGASGIGTYGHLIPAVRIDGQSFTAVESTLYMTGVSATPKYRTNIYLLNLTSQPMPVTITAYEGQFGAAVGQFTQQVAPFQLTPISATQIAGAPADKPFSIAIKGSSDGLIAYESVVDNGSNDPIYVPAMGTAALGKAAMKNQVLPSIGHFQSWRSDVTIFNPDDQAVQFDLAFYDTTGALKAEAKDKILPAKGLLQLDDILRSDAMSIPEDIIGTLRLSVDSPLADQFPVVAQRNYSDAGDQKRFGQGILGFGAADANVKPGKPAIIPAVRNDQLYKSNVGLINVGAADATIQLTLLDQATGQPVGVYPVTLKPNESRILPEAIPNVFLSTTDRGSIKVEVTNDGLVWAFAAIIDRATSDPEYVPAIQLD